MGIGAKAFAALADGDRETALRLLVEEIPTADKEAREELRRAIVGVLSEMDPADPVAREHRRRLAAALY